METKSDILTLAAMSAGVIGAVAFCAGATIGWCGVLACGLLLFFLRLRARMGEDDFRRKRILSILMFSAVALCAAAYLMMEGKRYWLLPLMISACVEFYSSFRLK